jgi:hypothetical protein
MFVYIMQNPSMPGPGDIDNAMQRLEARYGLPFWTLWHLRKGKAKSCEVSMFARIRGAYFDMCQKQADSLLHELIIEAATDDTVEDLEAEARALAAKIAARRAAVK